MKKKKLRPRNPIAKDLRTPKYAKRVVETKPRKAQARSFDDFCVYCLVPKGNHAEDCLLKGFGP